MSQFTDVEKREAAEREVRFRRSVYARRVKADTMRQHDADREIAVMQEIADDYRQKSELPL